MSELSRRLMVSGGNVTALVDQLVDEGLVVTGRRATLHDLLPAELLVGQAPRVGERPSIHDALPHDEMRVGMGGDLRQVGDAQDLVDALPTTKAVEKLSVQTGIPVEWLTLLRRHAMRPKSQPPPRTGNVVKGSFPPPASTLLPPSWFRTTPLKLTTARYYTPSGKSVQAGGIDPDIAVPQLSDPDYKDRTVIREADLRKHLINAEKVDDATLEQDARTDPRFSATAEQLKKQGIEDFQLHYALQTIARSAGKPQVATKGR